MVCVRMLFNVYPSLEYLKTNQKFPKMWTLIIIKTLIFLCCFDLAKTNFRDNHDIIFLNLGKIYINPKSIKVFKNIPIKPLRQTINNLQILLQTYRFLNFPFDRNIEFLKIKNNLTFFKNKHNRFQKILQQIFVKIFLQHYQ